MRNAAKLLLIAALAGCGGDNGQSNETAVGNEVKATNETLANADIEALPADESAATTSEELANGVNEPDGGNLTNSQ